MKTSNGFKLAMVAVAILGLLGTGVLMAVEYDLPGTIDEILNPPCTCHEDNCLPVNLDPPRLGEMRCLSVPHICHHTCGDYED